MSKLTKILLVAIIFNVTVGLLATCLYLSDGLRLRPTENEAKLRQLIVKLQSEPPEKAKAACLSLLSASDYGKQAWIGITRRTLLMGVAFAIGNVILLSLCLTVTRQSDNEGNQ
jgi:hypothetical protein